MKAVVLDDRNQFSVAEVPEPVPGPGQVAIRVAYAGIQWGDVLVRDGHFPVPRPFTPGFEAAGQVIAAGTGVEDVSVGDSVIALTSAGAFAELAVAPAVLTLPASGLDLRTAAASGWTTPTAYDLISTVSRVRPGDRVLIHAAAGAVGTMAAQFARRAGAGTVTGVAGDPARAAYAASFGYDRVLTRSEFPQALGGESFDVILDPVGGPARHASLNLLAPHGRLAVYGNIATFEPVTVSANDLLMTGASLLTYNSSLLSQTSPARLAESARLALESLANGQVKVDITAEYAMADIGAAIHELADGTTRGKSIVRIA
jgi:NADPH2:quinone reductase